MPLPDVFFPPQQETVESVFAVHDLSILNN
jgi:hypothetical protein